MDRQLPQSVARARARVRRLRRLQARRGDGVGGRAQRRRAPRPPDRRDRRDAGDAQEADGYLNTRFGHRGPERRYTDLEWGHELYCYGHLIQAAVARLRTRGEDRLVEIARRAADHVCDAFGPDGNQGVCGHPEVEMALVELYRATGEERYLEQARLFVERRGAAGAGRHRARARVLPGRHADPRRGGVPRARRPRALPGERGGRRRGRDRRRRAAGRDRAPVGADDRPPHLPDGRHGVAPQRRVVRRGLRAAAGPRVLGDVRRRRVGDARLAPAARHRRRALRRPRRAHALQRGRDVAGARRLRVLLREPAPPARARRRARAGRREPARLVEPARAVVLGLLLPDQRRPHAGEPRRATWRRSTTTGCRSTSSRLARCEPRLRTGAPSRCGSRRTIRGPATSRSASSRPTAARGG